MKTIRLHSKRVMIVLFVLLFSSVGMTKAYASYDFEAVCPSGQTLYYNIIDTDNHYVEVTCPSEYGWYDDYTKPIGEVTIPSSITENDITYLVTSIGDDAFYWCPDITSVTIPNSVTSIGEGSFMDCYGLTSFTIPYSVTSIGDLSFGFCYFLASITIPNSVTSIGNYAFISCFNLASITIPNSVTSIGGYAFSFCSSLEQITVSAGNPVYDSRNNCNAIIKTSTNELAVGCKNIVIPNSVTSIGIGAFYGYNGLTSITIPNFVTTIEDYAFGRCGITSVTIPNSVTYIGNNPFYGCSGLEQITVSTGNPVYDSRNGCNAIIKTSTNELLSGCKSTIIPNSVTSIGSSAFYGCGGLTSIIIPNSVTSIGYSAFDCCRNLTSVTIGNSITSIGNYAFNDCYNLASITIPNSVTTIGYEAFSDCSGLTSVTIGNSVTSIGNGAFEYCNNLNTMTVLAEMPPTFDLWYYSENYVFYDVDKSIPVYVPTGTSDAYRAADGWNEFTNYIERDNTIYEISAICNPPEAGIVSVNMEENTWISESFEEYPVGDKIAAAAMAAGHDWWTTFSNAPGGSEDGVVSDFDNTQCGHLTYGNDLVLLLGDKEHGNYDLEFDILVPEGKNGYFNILHHFASQNSSWAMTCYLHMIHDGQSSTMAPGHGTIHAGSNGTADLPCVYDAWMHFRVHIDADHDIAQLYFNVVGQAEELYAEWQWSLDNYGTNLVGRTLAALDFYPPENAATSEFYLDNISIKQNPGTDFTYGSICSLRATANPGFSFMNWTHNGEVVSTEPVYSFIVNENAEYIANFDSTPLGDFTYMSPTNNYPFTSLPITFTWDAVANAQHYDLYLWNANDSAPEEPFVSGLTNGYYQCTSLPNHQAYQWYVKAYNPCNAINSETRTFTLDVEPALNVNQESINFGEVALNQGVSTTLNVSGTVLEDSLSIEITGEDATMFSFTESTNWDEYLGGDLIVTFTPTVAQYAYHANLVISSGTFSQTVALTGSLADYYVFHTYVDEEVYPMNNIIPIHGDLKDANGNAVSNAEVEINIFVMDMKRSLQATTDENGEFAANFEPIPSESGYYTVNSGRVGNNSTAVHDDFNIPGMAVVTSDYILCAVTQDQPKTDSILIRNKCNLQLNNIQLSMLSAPEGSSFSFSPLSLGGLEEDYLVYTVTGSTLTQGNYYEEVKLKATSSEGAETIITVWYYCMEPKGVLDVAPNRLATTMTKGKSKIVDVMLSNNGTGATGNITIDLPDVEWMSVVGNDTMPSLAVNDTTYFSLRFSPDDDIPLVQYSGNIAINCEHGEYANLPFAITAVSDSTGTFVADITDDYTWNTNNGNGPHLEGAKVTLKGYYSLETVAQGYTDANGIFQVDNLPEGYYRLHVEADRHDDYNGTILVDAGTTNRQDVFISYQTVTYGWNVVPGEIQDEYEFILNTIFETNVPAPVITIDAPERIPDFEESYNFNYIITNHGLIDAYDIVLHTPEDEVFLFTALFDHVDTIHAQSTIVIPCMVTHLTNNTSICKHWVCSWVSYNYISGPNPIYRNAHDYTLVGTEQCGTTPPPANGGSGSVPTFGGGWGSGSGSSSLYINNIPVVTPSGSVNVQVGVQFNQQLVMTREAFFGTFSVHNGFDTEPLEAIGLNFTVKDENGNDCTSLFQISTSSLNNITSIDGNGSLAAGLDGMAQILFIPTKGAAPTEPKVYRFGGTFTFFDPYTNNTIVCDLYPVPLTVHPCPDLYVDYFMQRDIIGDDALTLDVVEPSVPAELGVIINNKGAGVAKNVILETAEPKIIDNDKGLAIDFAMYSASFNGNEAQLGLMEIPFGNIESGHTAVGEWLFTSSLLGHFVSYDAHVIHNNSYGNPNLSLVSHLDIHELIHPIRAYGNLEDGINDFLVNDVPDEHSYPDSIYFSNGGRTGVSIANHISFDHYVTAQDTIVTLTVRPSKTGWNYGVVDDPGSGYVLVGCMRNIDNQVIPLHNVWQTFVTLRDEQEPIYENKLHFVDTLSNGRQDYTYTLIYSLNEPTSPCQINIEDELCEGDDYTQYGFNLTDLPAGTYDETLYVQNTFGYDNIVSLHLVVYETPEVHIQIDTIHENGISFRLTATGAEHYEWSTGETTASIIVSPTEETTYSVIGTSSHGCSDSAEVTVFGGTGIGENGQMSSVKLYPNPAHDKLFIKTSELVNTIEIYTMTGVLVQQQSCWSDNMEIDVQNLSSGIYVIRLASDHAVETRRFVKE